MKHKQLLNRILAFSTLCLCVTSLFVSSYRTNAVNTSSQVGERHLPIYCVDVGNEKKIALSFDAAWGNEDTKNILAILKKHDIKVTFFMTGGWVEKYPDDVKAILEAGHDLGNHSENHKNMSQLSKSAQKEELMEAKLMTYDEAISVMQFENTKQILKNAAEFLQRGEF